MCVCRLCSPYSVCVRVYVWGMLLTVWDMVWKAPISVYRGLHKRKNINTTIAAKAFATLVLSGFHQWSQNNTRLSGVSILLFLPQALQTEDKLDSLRGFSSVNVFLYIKEFQKAEEPVSSPSFLPAFLSPPSLPPFPLSFLSLYWQANQGPCTYINYAKSLELLVCLFCIFVFPK